MEQICYPVDNLLYVSLAALCEHDQETQTSVLHHYITHSESLLSNSAELVINLHYMLGVSIIGIELEQKNRRISAISSVKAHDILVNR